MSFSERSSQPSRAQVEVLMQFLEQNRHIAKGFAKSHASRDQIRRHWEQITKRLNAMGGTIKTAKQWIKHWSDKKIGIRKKVAARTAARKRVAAGLAPSGGEDILFSEIEERMLAVLEDKPGAAIMEPYSASQSSMSRENFDEDAEMLDQLSPSPEDFRTGEFYSLDMDSMTPEPPPSPRFVVKIEKINENEDTDLPNDEDDLSILRPIQECVFGADKPDATISSPSRTRDSSPQPQKDPLPSARRPVTRSTPAKGSKFRYSKLHPVPLSQIKNGEISATVNRLLKIEEQQLELQRSHTKLMETLLEKSAERERLLVESLTTLAERDRVMTEAIREGFQASVERMQERDRITAEALRDGFTALAEALNRR